MGSPADELAAREVALTAAVRASFGDTPSPRLRELLDGLVAHLHPSAREVRLTEAEWSAAIDFLTRTGQITDERRQEFILLSDVLGLSMLTIGIGAPRDPRASEPTVFGPFFVVDAPFVEYGGDVAQGAPGEPCWVAARCGGRTAARCRRRGGGWCSTSRSPGRAPDGGRMWR